MSTEITKLEIERFVRLDQFEVLALVDFEIESSYCHCSHGNVLLCRDPKTGKTFLIGGSVLQDTPEPIVEEVRQTLLRRHNLELTK